MKVYTFFSLVILFAVAGCASQRGPKAKPIPMGTITTGDPLSFYDDSVLIFPVGMLNKVAGRQLREISWSQKTFFEANEISNRYYSKEKTKEYRVSSWGIEVKNLIFYNKFTKEKYPLLDSGITIISFSLHKEFKEHLIFY